MAREHLFRGKKLSNGDWVYGNLIQHPDGSQFICVYKDPTKLLYMTDFEVDPDTVCEYTDLKDSTGRKVFEGDILRFKDVHSGCEWIGRVEFGNPNGKYDWGFQLVFISGKKPNTEILLWFDMEEAGVSAEVIGNRWDNPELMEAEE